MKNSESLNGTWHLAAVGPGGDTWAVVDDPYPIPASVPGEVHPALQQVGLIPDPFYGMNHEQVQWVEEKDWWYRRVFQLPDGFMRQQTFLEFDGLDTYATVALDGEVIGEAHNMFAPVRFDVTGKLQERQDHFLDVRFASAARVAAQMDLQRYTVHHSRDRIGIRKYQAAFGWDWLPRFVGAGIWRSVRVVSYDQLAIRDLAVRCDIHGEEAVVTLDFRLENPLGFPVDARIVARIDGPGGALRHEETVQVPPPGSTVSFPVTVHQPALWWPNGYGEHPCYTATVEVYTGETLLDRVSERFGIRSVALQLRDEHNQPTFRFKINGQPIFAKGTNWVPADAFPSRITPERYRDYLLRLQESGANMVRVWGGGIYESPTFYEVCDELGLMVWQDFMFSFAQYPEWPSFTDNVLHEAHAVVKELRNHPSLVLWCGNNECEMDSAADAVWPSKPLFHEVIPNTLRELDPTRPYWPSCPYGGEVAHSGDEGDYHGEPWFKAIQFGVEQWESYFSKDSGLFMSEFPTQAPPEAVSLRRFIPENQLFPPQGEVWDLHDQNNEFREQKMGLTSNEAVLSIIGEMMGEPHSLDEYAELGGILQGEFLLAQIGYYRRRKWAMNGALLWMLADAWPCIGYSIIDYYQRPKPAYYYVKRAFAPIALIFGKDGDGVSAWVVNDTFDTVHGTVEMTQIDDGYPSGESMTFPVTVAANGVKHIWTGHQPDDPTRSWVQGTLSIDTNVVARTAYFFTLLKNIQFPRVTFTEQRNYQDGILQLHLVSDRYVRSIILDHLPDIARADDNYFDLYPRELRVISVRGVTASEAADIQLRQGYSS